MISLHKNLAVGR